MKVCLVKTQLLTKSGSGSVSRKERVVDLGCLADEVVGKGLAAFYMGLDVTGRSDGDNRMTDRNCATIWLWYICTNGASYCRRARHL